MMPSIASIYMLLLLGAASPTKTPEPAIKFPSGYRDWKLVKTMAITSDKHPLFNAFSGIHHVYANDTAWKAAKAGSSYPDGAVLIFDLLEWIETDGAHMPGARKLLAVMQKDAKRFKDTGGWGFEAFKAGDSQQRLVNDAGSQCYNCHAGQKDTDSVFSRIQE